MKMYHFYSNHGKIIEESGEVQRDPENDQGNTKCYIVTRSSPNANWFVRGYRWHDQNSYSIDRNKALKGYCSNVKAGMNTLLDDIEKSKEQLKEANELLIQAKDL